MAYDIEGKLLEVCTCNVLCPCWVGEDPDGGVCESALAWHMDKGLDRGRGRLRPDHRRLGPHPRERPDPEVVEGRDLRRRARLGRPGAGHAQGLYRPAGRRDRRPRRAHRRGRRGRARTHHVHGRRRQGPAHDRRRRRCRPHPLRRRHRQDDRPVGDRVLDDPRLPGLRGQVRVLQAQRVARTGWSTSTGRATTPSRATSASRPDADVERCSRSATSATPKRDRAILGGSLVALSALAWLSLWAWAASPYARYLHHEGGVAPIPVEALLFSLGWVLMIVAMMLPSSVPLVVTFGAIVGRRPQPRPARRRSCSPATSWSGALRPRGLGARPRHPRRRRRRLPWLAAHPQLIMGSTLAIAGLWQFSPLRARCLDECRSPLGFVMNRWRGRRRPSRVVPHGHRPRRVLRRLLLVADARDVRRRPRQRRRRCSRSATLTAVEKNMPWGDRLTRPLGFALILAAVYSVASVT